MKKVLIKHVLESIRDYHVDNPSLNGKMNLGQWQTLFLIEFDPIRERDVVITYISDSMRGGGAELDLVARFENNGAVSLEPAFLSRAQQNDLTSRRIQNESLTRIPKTRATANLQEESILNPTQFLPKQSIMFYGLPPRFSIQNTSSPKRKAS